MKKMIFVLVTMMSAATTAKADSDNNIYSKVNTIRSLKSILDCPIVNERSPWSEYGLEMDCVNERFATAVAHVKAATFVEDLAPQLETTWKWYTESFAGGIELVYGSESFEPENPEPNTIYSQKPIGYLLKEKKQKTETYSEIDIRDVVELLVQQVKMHKFSNYRDL